MVNKTFDKLFTFLLERNVVPLAMYRLPHANDNRYPYVSTNPIPSCAITMHDRVFVLGNKIKHDLIVDFNKEEDFGNFSKQKSGPSHMDADGDQIIKGNRGNESDFYGNKKAFPGTGNHYDATINDQENC